jgi:hypothetical protein
MEDCQQAVGNLGFQKIALSISVPIGSSQLRAYSRFDDLFACKLSILQMKVFGYKRIDFHLVQPTSYHRHLPHTELCIVQSVGRGNTVFLIRLLINEPIV